ncbi:MAG: hypothetical protein EOP49_49030, partial [Sphingobacteriales bacterium]
MEPHYYNVNLAWTEGNGGKEWRFWIGSRNLTGSTDLEAGLLLVSGTGRSARILDGMADLATDLLPEAEWTRSEVDQLRATKWIAPVGI